MPVSSRGGVARTGNRLLDRLPPPDFKPLARAMKPVRLNARQVLFRTDNSVDHIYFPTTAVLSLAVSTLPEGGQGIEVATVGNEGLVGITTLLGVPISLHETMCQVPGDCLRVPTTVVARAMSRRPAIDSLLKRYIALAYRTALQAVVCNALHPVEQRVCRWLLVMHERAAEDFPATQDFLASILGVKRPTISVVAQGLQKGGLITYHRGVVRIANRAALEQSACDCYKATRSAYLRIME